ncbi:MAG: J domain-containing protein [Bacteriovoracaceae bacterium]|nr:J domain-containing protein [Bacteriovoracaceae bacterium]
MTTADKTEIIIRVILSLFLIFVVVKIIGATAASFFDKFYANRRSKKKFSLDQMIENQKTLLRQKGFIGSKPTATGNLAGSKNKSTRGTSDETAKAYLQYFEQESKKGSPSCADIKKTLAIFDCIQWGDGKAFGELRKYVSGKLRINIEVSEISSHTTKILKSAVLLSLDTKHLPTYQEVRDIITVYIFLERLNKESQSKSGPLIQKLAKDNKTSLESTIKGVHAFFLKKLTKGSAQETYNLILDKKAMPSMLTPLSMRQIVTTNNKKHFRKLQGLISELNAEVKLFSQITALPMLKSDKDIDGAYKILNLPKNSTLANVKSNYKKMAALIHPDKLSGKKLPEKVIKQASKNFVTLQKAYEILINIKK